MALKRDTDTQPSSQFSRDDV
jgi:hypothetical protein